MATETISRLSAVNIASRSFLNAWRRLQGIANGPVEGIDSLVIADPALLKSAVVAKNIGLRNAGIAEGIKDGLAESFFSIRHTINGLSAFRDNFVRVDPRLVSHSGMRFESRALRRKEQRASHRSVRLRMRFLRMAPSTNCTAGELFSGKLLARLELGEVGDAGFLGLSPR